MRNPMFVYDEQLTNLILDYCRWRLALDPVPLDFGGAQASSLDASLRGLINAGGTDAHRVMEVFDKELATAVVSCDSPRFLSFIPAAPTKASLLFDMVVACSSLQGTSWMEAAGAVAAENQALGVLAGLAGLPAGAGGCFVSGGSAGNLSALMVARDTAAHRLGGRSPRPTPDRGERGGALLGGQGPPGARGRSAPGPLRGPPADRGLSLLRPRAPSEGSRRRRGGGHRRHDQRRDHRRSGRGGRGRPPAVPVVPRRRCLRLCRALRPLGAGPLRRHRDGRLPGGRPPQVALRPLRLRRPRLPGAQPGQGRPHPGRVRISTCSTATPPRSGTPATTPTT